jgi:tetratricopeptide (TPR) repeat protein
MELPAIAFDALDEAIPGSLTAILSMSAPLLSLCPLVVSARTMKGLQEMVDFNPRLSVIRLAPLTENEIRAWINSIAPSLLIDDAHAIRTLTEASEGNFLFLRSISVPQTVADIFQSAAALPSTMREVLERITLALCRRNPLIVRFLCLAIILPDGFPEEPTRAYFGLDLQTWGELLDIVDEVFKPGKDGITLFHGKYRDYLLDALAPDIIAEAQSLVANRTDGGSVFQDPRVWPFIYRHARDQIGLVAWIAALAKSHTSRTDRLREARAVVDATSGLLGEKAVAIVQVLKALEIYIEGNFQVLMDWQILVDVVDRLRSALVVVGLQRFPVVALGCVGTLYVARRLDEALALIERLPVPDGHDKLHSARYWDYYGLILGALGLPGKAVTCFGKAADAVADISDSAWLGYALMNRGKLLLSQDPIAGLEDIGQACAIRERIAFDPESLERNRQDVVSETQALITFAMGQENLMNAHAFGPLGCRSDEQATGYADRLEAVLDMLLERDPEGTRTFGITGRIVISLVLFLEQRGRPADRWREFLTTIFVPESQHARLNHTVP